MDKYTAYIHIIIIDNNSVELHQALDGLGYKPLKWTTCAGREGSLTILSNSYTNGGNGYGRNVYWNTGEKIEAFERRVKQGEVLVCETVEEFIEKAEFLSREPAIVMEIDFPRF